MESLKRKLSTTRRPETANRNLLPELNQYKQNNVALQTQISSLMAKLNESKKSEKALRATLQDVEQRCAEWEGKAGQAQQLESSVQALQNTIDHLENRLEIANTEKLDAQEEIFNMRALKSPFDAQFPELQKQWTTKNDQQVSSLGNFFARVVRQSRISTDP
jgi:chromosome segregation ATPase